MSRKRNPFTHESHCNCLLKNGYAKLCVWMALIGVLCVQTSAAQTGYAYTDAVKLRVALASKDSLTIKRILTLYYGNEQSIIEKFRWKSTPALPEGFVNEKISEVEVSNEGGFSSVSALSAIDALGTFIANRFKDEINVAFLTKFRNDMGEIPMLGSLLPQSNIVLQQSDPYNYANFMEALREAFSNDLQKLPSGIAAVIQQNQVRFNDPDTKFLLLIGLNFSQQVTEYTGNPLTAFDALANDTYVDSITNKKTRVGIEGVIYLVNALKIKDVSSKRLFMGRDELITLAGDTVLKQLYLMLLEQQNKNLNISISVDNVLQKISKASELVKELNAQIGPINKAIQANQLKPEQVVKYYQTMMNMLSELLAFSEQELHESPSSSFKVLYNKLQQINHISSCLLNKQYALAAIYAITLVEESADSNMLKYIGPYLLFATNILKAENSADMQQALENAALPVGSYRIKRNTTLNISLNAFGGLSAGVNHRTDTGLVGFTAPLGVYVGFGNIRKNTNRGGKSIGLYIPLIDVGAVTSLRLSGGSTELADISWSNVLSPGAYVSVGLGKCPVSVNIGGQVGPELSSVSATGTPVFYEKKWFWRASLLIDIPVFDFYNRQHKHHIKNNEKNSLH